MALLFPLIGIFVFGLLAVLFIVVIPNNTKKKEQQCSQTVLAKIVELKSSADSPNMFAPVYEYSFNGNSYRKESNVYTNYNVPAVGTERKLLIDPNNPDVYTDPERNASTMKVMKIIGFCMAGGAVVFVVIGIMINI